MAEDNTATTATTTTTPTNNDGIEGTGSDFDQMLLTVKTSLI